MCSELVNETDPHSKRDIVLAVIVCLSIAGCAREKEAPPPASFSAKITNRHTAQRLQQLDQRVLQSQRQIRQSLVLSKNRRLELEKDVLSSKSPEAKRAAARALNTFNTTANDELRRLRRVVWEAKWKMALLSKSDPRLVFRGGKTFAGSRTEDSDPAFEGQLMVDPCLGETYITLQTKSGAQVYFDRPAGRVTTTDAIHGVSPDTVFRMRYFDCQYRWSNPAFALQTIPKFGSGSSQQAFWFSPVASPKPLNLTSDCDYWKTVAVAGSSDPSIEVEQPDPEYVRCEEFQLQPVGAFFRLYAPGQAGWLSLTSMGTGFVLKTDRNTLGDQELFQYSFVSNLDVQAFTGNTSTWSRVNITTPKFAGFVRFVAADGQSFTPGGVTTYQTGAGPYSTFYKIPASDGTFLLRLERSVFSGEFKRGEYIGCDASGLTITSAPGPYSSFREVSYVSIELPPAKDPVGWENGLGWTLAARNPYLTATGMGGLYCVDIYTAQDAQQAWDEYFDKVHAIEQANESNECAWYCVDHYDDWGNWQYKTCDYACPTDLPYPPPPAGWSPPPHDIVLKMSVIP